MAKHLLIDGLAFGAGLWLIGYILGIVFFFFVPAGLIGWVIMPIGIIITLWVLLKKIKSSSFLYYLIIALIWTIMAVVLDYFLLVKVFKPADGYYKLDVYIYYILTFILPLAVGAKKYLKK